ncbi:MAG: hypothetical protein ACOCTP_00145 [Roseicyclus sp.]
MDSNWSDGILEEVANYVQSPVPDAMAALRPAPRVLAELVRSKLTAATTER